MESVTSPETPEPERVFFDADRVFVSDYRLRYPYQAVSGYEVRFPIRTVEIWRVRSAVVHEAELAVGTGLNTFFRIFGGLIKWPAALGAMGLFIISCWNLLFMVLDRYEITGEGLNPGGEPLFPAFFAFMKELWVKTGAPAFIDSLQWAQGAPFPAMQWLILGAVILALTPVVWSGDKIMGWGKAKTTKYGVGVDVVDRRGENGWLYFGQYDERAEAERIVSAIEHAIAAGDGGDGGRG